MSDTSTAPAQTASPRVARLLQALESGYAPFAATVRANAQANPALFDELGDFALACAEGALGEDAARKIAAGYAHFVTEVNREHIAYCKRGHYRNRSYDEVYRAVYDDDKYMEFYHWGVFGTLFLWEHHLKIYEFFRDRFAATLPESGRVLDFGSGSGIWSLLTAKMRPGATVTGVDISKSSRDIAESLARAAGSADRTSFTVADALAFSAEEPADAGISCFLLEHLETPDRLLANLARNVKPGAPVFITAAVTAAEVDHIYEFRSEAALVELVESAGFRLRELFSSAPRPDPRNAFLPRSVAMVLSRKQAAHW